ncbi:MAG: flagellar basal-body MS-ring/collar protein FliF [Clostridia bacterium]|nr:flagellar basal-body MS-ring/collar protein FliF [Clostridia bacterium]
MASGAQFQEQINNLWQKFSKGQKITVLFIIILFLAVIIGIIFAQQPKMEMLYSGLSSEDASALTAKLKEQKVPYQLADEGKTILVRAEDKYQLRLDMAGQVNLKGVIGFESFNETRFGETDTDKRVKYLVALQGELTRTIEYLDAVETAKIHIVLPQPALFVRDEKETTASVLLRLKAYASLRPEQVKSIMSFVSHSVEGLKPENVTVMDVNGNLLSEGLGNGSSGDTVYISANQLALKQQYEKEFAKSLQTMLEKMRGAGKAVVRASIAMNFDQVETHSERYDDTFLVSEHIKEESSRGISQPVGENPADANMGGPSYGQSGSGTSEHELIDTTRNFDAGKTVETKTTAPGKITNISLAVLVDGDLTPEEENKIKEVVAKAAGVNTDRGDQVSVVGMPFNTEDVAKMEEALAKRESFQRRMEYLKFFQTPLMILLILGIIFFVVRRAGSILPKINYYPKGKVPEIAAISNEMPNPNVELTLSPEAMEKKAMQKQVDNLVQKNPVDVAKVVKTWLAED